LTTAETSERTGHSTKLRPTTTCQHLPTTW